MAFDCAAQLLVATPLLMRRIRAEMRQRTMPGLSVPQYRTLFYLHLHRGATLSAVADFLGLTRPTTSKLVQLLVIKKIVARRVGADRRSSFLSLTSQGRKTLVLARQGAHEQLAKRLQRLHPGELEIVAAALQVLIQAFSEGAVNVHVL